MSAAPRAGGGRAWRRRLALGACVGLALLAAGLGAARAFRPRPPPPAPPEVDLAGADPAVSAAVGGFREEVLRSPESADAWGRLGKVLLANGFPAEACSCFAEAGRLDPAELRWPYLRGLSLTLLGEPDDAIPHLGRAAELAGRGEPAPRLRLAETLLGQGRVGEAEEQFRRLLAQDPDNPWARLGLGRVCCRRGEIGPGLAHLRRAAASPLTEKRARSLLAEVHQRRGEPEAARRALRAAGKLPEAHDFPDPYLDELDPLRAGRYARTGRANRLINQGRPREAAALFVEVLRDHPDLAEAWLGLGLAQLHQGDPAGAERALREAVRLDPKVVQGQFYLAVALLRQGKPGAAAGFFREAAALKPDHAPSWYNLGLCRKLRGDRRGAVDALRTAVRHKPNFVEARLELAELLLAGGRRDEGVEELKAVVAMDPGHARARALLAKHGPSR
jgi:tetratricopeptide (TPR) repeat protein